MKYTLKTQKELDQEAFDRGYTQYLKMFFAMSLIVGLCIWASKPNFISKAIDQDLGIYKQHTPVRAGK